MKKLNLFTVFFVCLFLFSVTSNATGKRTEFVNFEISAVKTTNTEENIQKTWQINYNENESSVIVEKHTTNKGNVYVARTEYFEVSYVLNSNGFGARTIKNSWRKVPFSITNVVINNEELKKQQKISPNKIDDTKALNIIASYLPKLINDNYTHVLN